MQALGCVSEEVAVLVDRAALGRHVAPQRSQRLLEKRKQLVWEIDKKLQVDGARPIIYYAREPTCWQSSVKGLTIMTNSPFNGWRMEDVWLER